MSGFAGFSVVCVVTSTFTFDGELGAGLMITGGDVTLVVVDVGGDGTVVVVDTTGVVGCKITAVSPL